ncbi:hypothetical protein [Spirosoma agri]|uniref:Uncharacterized protein n=1 Tax=Spirosoma agri TaxID=1987381 RepID=A0A6M0IR69_9BACT|nr:hypothetical protein [Spirosoma agri]NEU70407.1 hypothetical protein [Spirosoma agri]
MTLYTVQLAEISMGYGTPVNQSPPFSKAIRLASGSAKEELSVSTQVGLLNRWTLLVMGGPLAYASNASLPAPAGPTR